MSRGNWPAHIRTARKRQLCMTSGCAIQPGDQYRDSTIMPAVLAELGLPDEHPAHYRECAECAKTHGRMWLPLASEGGAPRR